MTLKKTLWDKFMIWLGDDAKLIMERKAMEMKIVEKVNEMVAHGITFEKFDAWLKSEIKKGGKK